MNESFSFDLQLFAAANKVPELISDMRVYQEGRDIFVGVTNVELPEIATQTTSITGIGMAGEIDAPVQGHFGSLELTLNWRTPTLTSSWHTGGGGGALEIMGDIQVFDHNTNNYANVSIRIVVRGRDKSYSLGSFEAGNTSDSSNTIEVHYLKIELDGTTVVEIDKFGYKCVINGVDLMATTRRNIGMN